MSVSIRSMKSSWNPNQRELFKKDLKNLKEYEVTRENRGIDYGTLFKTEKFTGECLNYIQPLEKIFDLKNYLEE